jgi:thiosulfate reductase cytochrome b subunit
MANYYLFGHLQERAASVQADVSCSKHNPLQRLTYLGIMLCVSR